MVGPFFSLFIILSLLIAGWQAVERKFSQTGRPAQQSAPTAQTTFKVPELPLELPRHEVIYHSIRQQALSLDTGLFRNFDDQDVWTILAEVKTGTTAVTLLAGIDGTVSLYSSTGQNSLGHGKNRQIQQAARQLFTKVKDSLPQFVEADEIPLPKEGEFVFYIYGAKGPMTSKIPDFDLDHTHPLYSLMLATNEVLQLMEQNSDKEKTKR